MAAAAASTELAVRTTPAGGTLVLVRMKAFWASRNSTQRAYLGLGAVVVLAAIAYLSHTMTTPDYKPVMSGLEAADAQSLGSQLAAKKIPFIVSPDGTSISVPADQVEAARMELASHDSPHSGRIGFEIFDKVSWGETEFDEKVNYQRALEGELERTIQTMSNVKSARVHLVMANESVFSDRDRPAKASVTLRLRRGSLSKDEAAAITRLVAGAVDNLKPEDVALVDADSNKSLTSSGTTNDAGTEAEQEMSKRLVATLAPIVGAEGVHATVNVDYDNTSSEESEDKYDPSVSVPLNVQKSEEVASAGGAAVGGIPGTSSNLAKPKSDKDKVDTASTAQPGQSSKSESATYGVNRTTRHVVSPGGRIHRITAAVLVDDVIDRHQDKGKWIEAHHKRSPEEMKLITELAQSAIGFDSARGDVVSVENLAFSHPQAEDLAKPTFVEKAQKGLKDNSSLVRYGMLGGALLFVYLLMIRPIQKRVLAMPAEAATPSLYGAANSEIAPLPITSEDLAARSLALKKQLADFVRKEPENSATTVRAWLREEVQ